MKVTPESAVPIIPKATKYQGDFLLALKKVSLLLPDFLFIKYEIPNKTIKYDKKNKSMVIGCISFFYKNSRIMQIQSIFVYIWKNLI